MKTVRRKPVGFRSLFRRHSLREYLFFLNAVLEKLVLNSSRYLGRNVESAFDVSHQNEQKNVFLFPYNSLDCRHLYSVFARNLELISSKQLHCTVFESMAPLSDEVRVNEPIPSDTKQLTYAQKLRLLWDISYESPEIFRGVIDEYRKRCEVDEFIFDSPINLEIKQIIILNRDMARKLVGEGDVFILPDLSYTFARTIHYFAKLSNKKVFVLNPKGEMLDVSSPYRFAWQSRTVEEIKSSVLALSDLGKAKLEVAANEFILKRSRGLFKFDKESQAAYKTNSSLMKQFEIRNVLFLHCMRDASRDLPSQGPEEICLDYIEWAHEMFKLIAKNPQKWWIKIHPSSSQFSGEMDIVCSLINKYRIPLELIADCPDTASVLERRLPVYTFSGTIALETASHGYKSNTFGKFYPDWMCENYQLHQVQNRTDQNLIKYLSREEASFAAIALMLSSKSKKAAWGLCPSIPVSPSTSHLQKIFRSWRSILSILPKTQSKRYQILLESLVSYLYLRIYNDPATSIDWESKST